MDRRNFFGLGLIGIVTSLTSLTTSEADAKERRRQREQSIDRIIKGIDVSHHQRNIRWNKVRSNGYIFAYIKASEGIDWKDPNFDIYLSNAKKAGLYVGCYHYATCKPDKRGRYNPILDAKTEAEYFLKTAKKGLEASCMRPALDLEHVPGIDKLTNEQLAEFVITWMDLIKTRIGAEPLLYGFKYSKKAADGDPKILDDYDIWLAHYGWMPNPKPWKRPLLWQYDKTGKIPGVQGGDTNGYVDLNMFYGIIAEF